MFYQNHSKYVFKWSLDIVDSMSSVFVFEGLCLYTCMAFSKL